VRDRIRKGKGYLRMQGSDYLSYAITDSAIDMFFPLLEKIGDRMDELEDELITAPTRASMNRILQIKRELIVFRRSIWPERDKINDLIRSHFPLVSENTKVYFRDSYDHCIQILDIVDSFKEVTSSLMDVYLSSVSNRLNQVMKVLTIISTIFIPLTFIVGLYGMNFAHVDPRTGKDLPLNMPELYSPYGYIGVMLAMFVIVIIQIYFFYKKGWLNFRMRDY
jgi:magnesium transporter